MIIDYVVLLKLLCFKGVYTLNVRCIARISSLIVSDKLSAKKLVLIFN